MLRRDAVLTWDCNQSVDERRTFIGDTPPPLRLQTAIRSLFSPLGQSGRSRGFLLMNVKSNDGLFKKHFNTFKGKTELSHNQLLYLAHHSLDRLLARLKTLKKRRNAARLAGSSRI